jgi:iron complex outermembrane receptor protein
MTNISTLNLLKSGAAPIAMALATMVMPAQAQIATPQGALPPPTPAPADDPSRDIVVTGSLIRNPNLVQSNPVISTNSEEISLKQSNTAEEVIRDIPGIVPDLGSAVNNGTNGAANVDLRGLGANRNLVLIDGNRIVPTGIFTAGSAGAVDLNSIPLALVERVDVLTGAAVTTYGADAIAGVVNFVTKKHFTGIDLSLGDQITEQGDGHYYRSDLTLGTDLGGGKGNIVVSGGYQHSDPVYEGSRDFSTYALGSFKNDPNSNSGTSGGGLAAGSGTSTPTRFLSPVGATGSINPTTGAITPGYVPYNFNPFNLLQTGFKRYNVFAQANYQLSDAIEVYGRGLYAHTEVASILAPAGLFSTSLTIPYSNPYLPAPARGQLCAANGLTAAQCGAAALATSPADPNYKTFTATLRRRMPEAGTRDYNFTTRTFDVAGGFRGELNPHIHWDIQGSYGESQSNQVISGFVRTSRIQDALLATNTTTCLSGNAGCVPLNLFGATGTITPAQVGYIAAPSLVEDFTSLGQAHGQLSGDLGFHSPGATTPISFAVGAEYRTYSASQAADANSQNPGELSGTNGSTAVYNGSYHVYEGFAELIAPLVEDKPFFHELTAEGGVRYSRYKVAGNNYSIGTFTYKGGVTWDPVEGLRLRANYAHAVRAPNLYELFQPVTTQLTNLAADPCAGSAPLTNPTLKAVCIAQRAPAAVLGTITNPSGGQANYYGGGNVNLKPEKADTYTVGAVFTPKTLRSFNATIDYYHIVVNSVIGTPLPNDAVSACFGAGNLSPTNPACTAILRDPTTGQLDGSPATGPGLPLTLSNLGHLLTKGIDVTLNFHHDLGAVGYSLSVSGNHTIASKYQASPTSINRECVGYYSVNCSYTGSLLPKWQLSVRNTAMLTKDIELSLLWRHISSFNEEPLAQSGAFEAFRGKLPAGIGSISGQTVNFGHINPYDIFDLTAKFTVQKIFIFTVAVQNMFDKKPSLVGYNIGSTAFNAGNTYPSTYDTLGRRYAVSAEMKF